MKSSAVTVGTDAALVVAADDLARTVYLHHESNQAIFIGGSDVSTANGLHMKKGQTYTIALKAKETLYAVADLAAQELRVLTPDVD